MLTVYGIETKKKQSLKKLAPAKLQQCLPFTVLKQGIVKDANHNSDVELQQCLPFTVLKLQLQFCNHTHYEKVATVLTVYGIETLNARTSC